MSMDAGSSSRSSSTSSSSSSSSSNSSRSSSSSQSSQTSSSSTATSSTASSTSSSDTSSQSSATSSSPTDSSSVGLQESAAEREAAEAKACTFADAWGAEESSSDSKEAVEGEQEAASTQTAAEYNARSEALGSADLSRGAKNDPESVKALQSELQTQLGRDVGGVDGKFGPKTEAAVKEFQQQNGLEATGKVDETTRQALLGDKPEQAEQAEQAVAMTRTEYDAKAAALGTNELGRGMKNDANSVKALQGELENALGREIGVDGKFGPKTEEAVKEFQERNGLEPSGKFDDKTRDALLGDKPAMTREELQDQEAARQAEAANPKEDMIFGDMLSAEEQDKVRQIAEELGTNPNDLMAVMAVETGGTFDPAERAGGTTNGAVGLIQFTGTAVTAMNQRRAAEGLEPISKDALSQMSFVEQMDHVRDYLQDTFNERGFQGEIGRDDLYAAILAPASLNRSDSAAVYSAGTKNYNSNKSLDTNRDGKITRAEMTARVEEWYNRGMAGLAS